MRLAEICVTEIKIFFFHSGMMVTEQSVRINTTRPLTVWIVGTDIERGLFSADRCAILGSVN